MTKEQLLIVLAVAFVLGLAGSVWLWGAYGLLGGSGVLFCATLFVTVKKEGPRG